MCEKKRRTKNLLENTLHEYSLFFSINLILICTVLPGIKLKWNISFEKKNMKIRKISTSYLPNILKIVPERYEERKKTGNEQCSVTLYTMYIERICDMIWIIICTSAYICVCVCI